ncbi:MAG: ABC transporter substrate-binding protein [Gammaproteobacteria bacterium]|nr:ABC transporter substrate-binding protein [Gammaproteobacteria bacterium]
MRNYLKTTAGIALSLGMTTATIADVSIGSLQGYTGPLESLIGDIHDGTMLAASEANASGAYIHGTINVPQGDSKCIDADAAISEAERLINEGVIGLVGPNCSGVTTAVINNVTAPNGVVNISPSATSPALSTIEDNGFFFRTAPSDARQGQVLASIAMGRGITSVAVTYTNNDYGKGLADAFIGAYEALGGTVTVNSGHEEGKADYAADVATLSAGGSSVLAVFGYADGGALSLTTASVDTGAFDSYIFADGMIGSGPALGGLAGLDGSWGTAPGGSDAAAAWATVTAAAGITPGPYSGEAYDAMALIILASQAAGSTDRGDIQAAVMSVGNAPGVEVYAGEIGKGLKALTSGAQINYVGATGVEFNDVGEVKGSFLEYDVVGTAWSSIKTHK